MQAHCGECGFPRGGSERCRACGATPREIQRENVVALESLVGFQPARYPEYQTAFRAQSAGEYSRMVADVLAAGGHTSTLSQSARGAHWRIVVHHAPLSVILTDSHQVIVEGPVVRLPERRRVPLMRAMLHQAMTTGPARVALRGEDLLFVFEESARTLVPPALNAAINTVGIYSFRYEYILALTYDAGERGRHASRVKDALPLPAPRGIGLVTEAIARTPRPRWSVDEQVTATETVARFEGGVSAKIEQGEALARHFMEAADRTRNLIHRRDLCGTSMSRVQRAAFFRAYRTWGSLLPGSFASVFKRWETDWVSVPLPGKPESNTEVIHRLRADRFVRAADALATMGGIVSGDPIDLAMLTTAIQIKELVATQLRALELERNPPEHEVYVLLGLTAELLSRCRLPDSLAGKLDEALRVVPPLHPSVGAAQLHALLGRIAQ